MNYDKIIIGAGIFGLYAAVKSVAKGEKVLILEYDAAPFKRASWINQARIHGGYHYPRSHSTAKTIACYFKRFAEDYNFSILRDFKQIYATSTKFSYTNANQFAKFCNATKIPCESIHPEIYFKPKLCDGAFVTSEYTFDAKTIGEHLLKLLLPSSNFAILFNSRIKEINKQTSTWLLQTNHGEFATPYVVNTTYASLNQILLKAGLESFAMKNELCEIILCRVSDNIKNVGITVMDGPFFSLMPFGKTGYHSLTAVGNTPHMSSCDTLPKFSCQLKCKDCNQYELANCNTCEHKPFTAFQDIYKLAKKYLRDEIEIYYQQSLFAMKAILLDSEVDDSRPTIVKFSCDKPKFLSIFSGKINTIYDLDEIL